MPNQRLALVLSLALASASFAGCGPDASPTQVRLAVVGGGSHGGAPLHTHMTQEVTSTPVWAGDPDGSGTALLSLNPGQGEVCWELSAADILLPASSAHIHRAAPGVRGPIVVALTAPDATGRSAGCRSDVDRSLVREILATPDSFYVNVHNAPFPAGAIRGQLGR